MPPAVHPQQEQLRLEALQALDILYLPLEERFDRITRILSRLFNVPIAYLALMEADTQWFKSIQGIDLLNTPRSDSLCQHTLLEDEMLICPDTLQDPRFADNPYVLGPPNARFYAGFLLKSRGQNIGTLCIVDTQPRTFGPEEAEMLRDIGNWAQTEINLTQLSDSQIELIGELDEAWQEARIDSLTRLWNQGAIKQILHRAYQRHLLNLTPLSVLMLDADYFKRVNDRFGHAAGDQVLQGIATALRHCLRADDAVGRYGGEEFMVVLDNCDTRRATELAERVMQRVRSLRFPQIDPQLQVTLSIGIAGTEARGLESEEDLMSLADQALYLAKDQGRDQLCVLHEAQHN